MGQIINCWDNKRKESKEDENYNKKYKKKSIEDSLPFYSKGYKNHPIKINKSEFLFEENNNINNDEYSSNYNIHNKIRKENNKDNITIDDIKNVRKINLVENKDINEVIGNKNIILKNSDNKIYHKNNNNVKIKEINNNKNKINEKENIHLQNIKEEKDKINMEQIKEIEKNI